MKSSSAPYRDAANQAELGRREVSDRIREKARKRARSERRKRREAARKAARTFGAGPYGSKGTPDMRPNLPGGGFRIA